MSELEYHQLREEDRQSRKKFQRNLILVVLIPILAFLGNQIRVNEQVKQKADKIELTTKADIIDTGTYMELMRLVDRKTSAFEAYVATDEKRHSVEKAEALRRWEHFENEIIEIYKQMGTEPTRGYTEEMVYDNIFEPTGGGTDK